MPKDRNAKRVHHGAHSTLIGDELSRRLHAAGLGTRAFARFAGFSERWMHECKSGTRDGEIPLALEHSLRHAEHEVTTGEFNDYIAPEMTGVSLSAGLGRLGMSVRDLARYTGYGDVWLYRLKSGRLDGHIPLRLAHSLWCAEQDIKAGRFRPEGSKTGPKPKAADAGKAALAHAA